jgi:hypothetical protein
MIESLNKDRILCTLTEFCNYVLKRNQYPFYQQLQKFLKHTYMQLQFVLVPEEKTNTFTIEHPFEVNGC